MHRPAAFIGLIAILGTGAAAQQRPPNVMFVTDADSGEIQQTITLLQFPHIFSPEISPDGKRVGVDGWGRGQRSVDAHVLIIDLEVIPSKQAAVKKIITWSNVNFIRILNVAGPRESKSPGIYGEALEILREVVKGIKPING